jgi:hypothetical protein
MLSRGAKAGNRREKIHFCRQLLMLGGSRKSGLDEVYELAGALRKLRIVMRNLNSEAAGRDVYLWSPAPVSVVRGYHKILRLVKMKRGFRSINYHLSTLVPVGLTSNGGLVGV